MNLQLAMMKIKETRFLDIDLAMETLAKYPEGVWFAPTNSMDNNDYDVISELAAFKLVARMVIPWSNGGLSVQFQYKNDFDYSHLIV